MALRTYETVTFTDRLVQAINQIKQVNRKMEEGKTKFPFNPKVIEGCSQKLLESVDTLETLRKEVLFYFTQ